MDKHVNSQTVNLTYTFMFNMRRKMILSLTDHNISQIYSSNRISKKQLYLISLNEISFLESHIYHFCYHNKSLITYH